MAGKTYDNTTAIVQNAIAYASDQMAQFDCIDFIHEYGKWHPLDRTSKTLTGPGADSTTYSIFMLLDGSEAYVTYYAAVGTWTDADTDNNFHITITMNNLTEGTQDTITDSWNSNEMAAAADSLPDSGVISKTLTLTDVASGGTKPSQGGSTYNNAVLQVTIAMDADADAVDAIAIVHGIYIIPANTSRS